MLGNLPEALRVLGEAAEQFRAERRSGDAKNRGAAATNLAGCLMTRAMVLQHQGNAPEMLTCLTEAEQILREGNSPDNLGRTLLTKTRVFFALSQFQQGIEALREAGEIFSRIGNFRWLLKCVEVRIRLAMQFGKINEALRFGADAVALAKERGTPHDIADALGQMAALCREQDLKEPAERFLVEAKSIASDHQLHDLLADCLLDEAGEGKAKTDEQRGLLERALEHLRSAMMATQVKGRRAVFMRRIATRYHKAARSSLAEMLRELRAWTSKFPEQADAILPAWFYLFGAEAWSNCRSLLGVKFLVHAPDGRVFESFAREWSDCGDLFIYSPPSRMRCERGIDVIPWDDEMLVPPTLKLAFVRKKQSDQSQTAENEPTKENNEAVSTAMVELLHRIPYYATGFSGPVSGLPAAKMYVIGRRHRLPQDVQDSLLSSAVEALIANRSFVLPREEREEADTALPMTIAWEGGHLPVFFGDPAPSHELSLEREASVQLPPDELGKRVLRRFMAEVARDSRSALTRLIEELEAIPKQSKPASRLVHGKLRVFRFKVGTQLVNHPALIL